jgi:hypothetical protein
MFVIFTSITGLADTLQQRFPESHSSRVKIACRMRSTEADIKATKGIVPTFSMSEAIPATNEIIDKTKIVSHAKYSQHCFPLVGQRKTEIRASGTAQQAKHCNANSRQEV